MIYATLGTMFMDFARLVRKMDEIARQTGEEIIVQTGMGKTLPTSCAHFDFKPRNEILDIQRRARVIVCHAGIGAVQDAMEARRPLIVVPRLRKFGEHMNDHQLDLAHAVEARGWGKMVLDVDELPEACAHPPEVMAGYAPAKAGLIAGMRGLLEGWAAERA